MKKREFFALSFHILLTVMIIVSSCKKDKVDNRLPDPNAMSVAILLPGPKNDNSWNQAGYEGLMMINKSLHAVVVCSENVTPEDTEDVFRSYAEAGYDFIIGHGGEFIDGAVAVASEYPLQKFAVTSDYEGNNRNLGGITFRDEETYYLAGMAAAMETQTGKVAYIGGISYQNIEDAALFFGMGARSVNSDIELKTTFIGSWTNRIAGLEIAGQLIDEGVDVIIVNADEVGIDIHRYADKRGIKTIGCVVDQSYLAPDSVITSVIQDVPTILYEMAYLVQKGRFEGKLYRFGIKENTQRLAPWYDQFLSENKARINKARQDIVTGKSDLLHMAETE